jgi:S1-C subfamily serine protease
VTKKRTKGDPATKVATPRTHEGQGSRGPATTDPYLHAINEWTHDVALRTAVQRVKPACFFVDSDETLGSGVAILIGNIPHVLTAGHCCGEEEELGAVRDVEFPDGRLFVGVAAHRSADYDLALLTLQPIRGEGQDAVEGLPVAFVAERVPQKGDPVVLVAQPGLKRLPRQQSCLGRVLQLPANPLEAQHDMGGLFHSCIVYAGNSGGPLLNAQGDIVGIHVTGDCFHGAAVTLQAIQAFLATL